MHYTHEHLEIQNTLKRFIEYRAMLRLYAITQHGTQARHKCGAGDANLGMRIARR
jgi:hypothetical protein